MKRQPAFGNLKHKRGETRKVDTRVAAQGETNPRPLDVYVFGAGASLDLGGPLGADLLHEGFWRIPNSDLWEVNRDEFLDVLQIVDILCDTCLYRTVMETPTNKIPGILSEDQPWVTIEELFSYVQVALRNKETWQNFRRLDHSLRDFVFQTLDSCIKGSYGGVYEWTDGRYSKVSPPLNCYERLVGYAAGEERDSAFISFNYDTLLDAAIFHSPKDALPDYGVTFDSEEQALGQRRIRFEQSDIVPWKPYLLKLHGSLNWSQCPVCSAKSFRVYQRYRDIGSTPCHICGQSRLVPMLAAPSYLKAGEFEPWKGVWTAAQTVITHASSITVIGYSFPLPDLEAKWLFISSLAQNRNRPTLTVVDPCEETRSRIRMWLHPWISSFREVDSFKQYCNQLRV